MIGDYITLDTAKKIHDIKQENKRLKKIIKDIEQMLIDKVEFCKRNEVCSINYEYVLKDVREIIGGDK